MADQSSIERLLGSLHWLGHDSFRLDSPAGAVYFDPYELKGGPVAALVLCSHDHFDHCVPEDVAKIRGPETVIVTEAQCAQKLGGANVKTMSPGDSLEVLGIKIKAVPAYNTDKEFHPQGNAWLGFVVTVEGVSIYHAGDTDHIPEMSGLEVDIALLPVSGTYVMTAEQAVQAALAIKPRLAIPMHYGAIVGDAGDAQRFAQALQGKVPVRILAKES
ncbi:MAG: MBL fold metallo-hydrolase [Desulfarculus sp.]|nr:MBL fold metallo-hydrolase [Desulfarculus sp.]